MGAAVDRADRLEDFMSEPRLVDITGRLRSPAATPGHWAGCAPPNKGLRFPADPPSVEEIILVMREAGPGPYADRTRGLIAILWRAGLRIGEALALTESDLDPKTGSVLVRSGKGGKRRMVGMDDWGWEHVARWSEHRVGLRDRDGARRDPAADHPASARARAPRDHLDLSPGDRYARDRRHCALPPTASNPSERWPTAVVNPKRGPVSGASPSRHPRRRSPRIASSQ